MNDCGVNKLENRDYIFSINYFYFLMESHASKNMSHSSKMNPTFKVSTILIILLASAHSISPMKSHLDQTRNIVGPSNQHLSQANSVATESVSVDASSDT